MSCGIGGDLFVIYWEAKTQKLYGLNASGRSPFDLSRDMLRGKGFTEIPTKGPLSWSVPGCVDGLARLQKRFGSKALSEIFEACHQLCRRGLSGHEIIARVLERSGSKP